MRFNQMLAEASSRAVPAKSITVPCNMKDMDSVFKWFLCFKPKFKVKTSLRNIIKLSVALQDMYSAEDLQMAASAIVIVWTISNGCLKTSLKIDSSCVYNFRSSHKSSWNYQEVWKITKM